jgi:hypothetical protein
MRESAWLFGVRRCVGMGQHLLKDAENRVGRIRFGKKVFDPEIRRLGDVAIRVQAAGGDDARADQGGSAQR